MLAEAAFRVFAFAVAALLSMPDMLPLSPALKRLTRTRPLHLISGQCCLPSAAVANVSTCREAVQRWYDGYTGADRDNDGISCENVCRSRKQVDEIREEIGC
jgi:hypothetical protein